MVKYVRRNFLVPIPSFESFDALNAHLEERCLERMEAKLRGHTETIGEHMERDLDALLPLPPAPYDASDRHTTRVSSLSLVRYRTNDYSAPAAYGHREVLVRGYVDEVVISCEDGRDRPSPSLLRARRLRVRSRSTTCRCWSARPVLWTRRRHWCRMGPPRGVRGPCAGCWSRGWERRGKREFVQVLRLMETFSPAGRPQRGTRMLSDWEQSARTRSSISCCAASRDGLPDSTSSCIPICPA